MKIGILTPLLVAALENRGQESNIRLVGRRGEVMLVLKRRITVMIAACTVTDVELEGGEQMILGTESEQQILLTS